MGGGGGGGGGGLGKVTSTVTGGASKVLGGGAGPADVLMPSVGLNTGLGNVLKSAGLGGLGDILQAPGGLLNSLLGGGAAGGGALVSTAGPMPEMEDFKSGLNSSGTISDKYKVSAGQKVKADKVKAGQLDVDDLAADNRALDAMRERALATGDSPWLKMQLGRQKLEETNLRDQAARQALSGAATARSQLAMRGGLGSGASTRVAMQSARDMNAARQGIGRQGALDRLNLGIADDQTKMGLLGQTANLDLAHAAQTQDMSKFNVGTALDASKTNAANKLNASMFNDAQSYDATKTNSAAALGQLKDENTFNAFKYGEQMKGYAGAKQGDAIANGGSGGKK